MHDPAPMISELKTVRLGILGSGKGSNFAAILAAMEAGTFPAEVAVVVADQPGAGILHLAREAGVPHCLLEEPRYRTKLSEETEKELVRILHDHDVELVVLAGFMRVLKSPTLEAYPRRILNIHPSLLPNFPGLAAWEQALAAKAKVTGCTVHYVDAGVDSGEVLGQEQVPVLPSDTPSSLHARIQEAEHRLYPAVLRSVCEEILQSR